MDHPSIAFFFCAPFTYPLDPSGRELQVSYVGFVGSYLPQLSSKHAASIPGIPHVLHAQRHPDETVKGEEFMSSESLLGKWVDSQA